MVAIGIILEVLTLAVIITVLVGTGVFEENENSKENLKNFIKGIDK